jgi:hypothetical protein
MTARGNTMTADGLANKSDKSYDNWSSDNYFQFLIIVVLIIKRGNKISKQEIKIKKTRKIKCNNKNF